MNIGEKLVAAFLVFATTALIAIVVAGVIDVTGTCLGLWEPFIADPICRRSWWP